MMQKRGFVILRHDEIRDITAKTLNEVCKDVEVESLLSRISGERFCNRTTIVGNTAAHSCSRNVLRTNIPGFLVFAC